MSLDQSHFRIRSDDTQGLNVDAGWAAALDTGAVIDAEKIFRVRFQIDESASPGAKTYKLQYRRNGGTWTDVPDRAVAESSQTATNELEAVLSAQYVDAAATSAVISSGTGFVAGEGEESPTTGSITLSVQHTEIEWAIRIRKLWWVSGAGGCNLDGDLFDLRVVESSGTVFGAYSQIPTITLNTDYRIGGVIAESVRRAGPWVDGNGNIYAYVEHGEPVASDEPTMMKSTDGGIQWNRVDAANAPGSAQGADDMESLDSQVVGQTIHILTFNGGPRVRYSTFNMSDHGSAPDTWQIKGETVYTNSVSPGDQDASISVRSDGTVVAIFRSEASGTDERLSYRIRSSGGTWGSTTLLDANSGSFTGCACVLGASDKTHIFYVDKTASLAYYNTLSSTDVLGTRTQYNATGTAPNEKPFTQCFYIDDNGTEHISATYRRASNFWERSVRGGTLQSERQINGTDTIGNTLAGSLQPAGFIVVNTDLKKIYACWIGATSPNDIIYTDSATLTGAFGTDAVSYDSPLTVAPALAEISGSTKNGRLYVVVDEGAAGLTGGVIFKAFDFDVPTASVNPLRVNVGGRW